MTLAYQSDSRTANDLLSTQTTLCFRPCFKGSGLSLLFLPLPLLELFPFAPLPLSFPFDLPACSIHPSARTPKWRSPRGDKESPQQDVHIALGTTGRQPLCIQHTLRAATAFFVNARVKGFSVDVSIFKVMRISQSPQKTSNLFVTVFFARSITVLSIK